MMLLLILGTIVIALVYRFLVRHYNYWTDRGIVQGKPVLLFGDNWSTLWRRQGLVDFMQYVYYMCPGTRYCGIYQFFIPELLVKDPELLKQITVKDFDHFTDHVTIIPVYADPLWGKNLFALTGKKWREMRTVLSPSFTSSKMKAMFVLMADCSKNFVQHFLNKNEDMVTVEMKDTFYRFTNDAIATAAFGIKVDSLNEPNNEFYLMGKEASLKINFLKTVQLLGYFLFPRLYQKLFHIKIYSDEVGNFFRRIINDTIKEREEKGIIRPDMIHLLMEARKGIQKEEENVTDAGYAVSQESAIFKDKVTMELTNEDITAQALVFFFAGFETIASLMTFTSYELAVNQDIQDRLRKEIYATLDECEGKLTYEGLVKMKYMDMVISETLRKWPNTVFLNRVCTKPYVIKSTTPEEKSVYVEKGTALLVPLFALHHDPEHFPDPERFDPERFSDENKKNIKPYTYMPFGLGPRVCIGSRFALLETKIAFSYLLLHFRLVPVEKTDIPLKLSKKTFFLSPDGPLWLGLERLNPTWKNR